MFVFFYSAEWLKFSCYLHGSPRYFHSTMPQILFIYTTRTYKNRKKSHNTERILKIKLIYIDIWAWALLCTNKQTNKSHQQNHSHTQQLTQKFLGRALIVLHGFGFILTSGNWFRCSCAGGKWGWVLEFHWKQIALFCGLTFPSLLCPASCSSLSPRCSHFHPLHHVI